MSALPSRPSGMPVPSPCISVCTIDQHTGLCAGCLRTLDEIAAWSILDDVARIEIWERIDDRRAQSARFDKPEP
jgi:hypothetical protein